MAAARALNFSCSSVPQGKGRGWWTPTGGRHSITSGRSPDHVWCNSQNAVSDKKRHGRNPRGWASTPPEEVEVEPRARGKAHTPAKPNPWAPTNAPAAPITQNPMFQMARRSLVTRPRETLHRVPSAGGLTIYLPKLGNNWSSFKLQKKRKKNK